MFDTLTPAERNALRGKLAAGGHKLAEVGHVLAEASLATAIPAEATLWAQSRRYYDAMTELYALREEAAAGA